MGRGRCNIFKVTCRWCRERPVTELSQNESRIYHVILVKGHNIKLAMSELSNVGILLDSVYFRFVPTRCSSVSFDGFIRQSEVQER